MKTIDILLTTYNQSQYIRQALDGIMMQRLEKEVKWRILVADDCSTDGTLDIIKTYALKHDAEWVFLPNEKNLGIAENYKRAIAATTAEYVAILEGDDYWTDANRLQKHVDYLSTHADCVMTKNNYFEYEQGNKEWRLVTSPRQYILLRNNIHEYILGNLSCTVFRGDVLRNVDERVYVYGERQRHEATDYYLTIGVLQAGYGYVLEDVMSVYRVGTNSNISRREMTYEEEIARGKLWYEQTKKLLGRDYDMICLIAHQNGEKTLQKHKQEEKIINWSEYLPPCIPVLLFKIFPKIVTCFKRMIRMCIPNKIHKALKNIK